MAFDPTDPYAGASSYAAIAEQAARTAYLDAQRRGQGESDALNAAKFAWQKTMDEAGLTGLYQGKPTMAASQLRGFFGSGAGEFSGMPTTEEQRISGYTDAGKTPTLSREQFLADTTGYYNGGATLAREQGQDKTTLGLLGILSGLRGPSDYFQYQKVLGGTPRGYADVVNQAFGRAYAPLGAGANLGAAEPASLQTMQRDVNQYAGGGGGMPSNPSVVNAGPAPAPVAAAPAASALPPGIAERAAAMGLNADALRAQISQYGLETVMNQVTGQTPRGSSLPYTPEMGQLRQLARGAPDYNTALAEERSWLSGGSTPAPAAPAAFSGGGAPMHSMLRMGGPTTADAGLAPAAPAAGTGFGASGTLGLPNQIDPQAWSRYAPSTKKLMTGDYEAGGLDPADVDWMRRLSLPGYRGATRGGVSGLFS